MASEFSAPRRIAAYLYLTNPSVRPPRERIVKLKRRLARMCAAQGCKLAAFVVERVTPGRSPAEHPALARVADGSVDAVLVAYLPTDQPPPPSLDALAAQIRGPVTLVPADRLRARELSAPL